MCYFGGEEYKNGERNKYEGEYKNDMRHGVGKRGE